MLQPLLQNGLLSSTRALLRIALALWAGAAAAAVGGDPAWVPPSAEPGATQPTAGATGTAEPVRPLGFADRFGLAGSVTLAPLARVPPVAVARRARGDTGEAALVMPSSSVRLGARFALLPRSEEELSATPTASLLVRFDDAGRPASMGLGLEARLGVALVKPVAGFFPLAELYGLAAVGGAGLGLRPDEAWLRLGVGLQLNLFTLLSRSFDFVAFSRAFFSVLDGYYRVLLSPVGVAVCLGLSAGVAVGGGALGGGLVGVVVGAVSFLAILVAAVVLPPLLFVGGFVTTLAGMAANVELSWEVATPGRPPMTELRLGIGF